MAVKPEKIKERLKALFPKANLSTKRLDEFAAKLATKPADDADDDAIDAIVNDANDLIGFEAVAKEDDRVRTLEAKAKEPKPADPADPKPADPSPADPNDPNKALLDAIQGLTAKVEAMEKGKTLETQKQTALAAVQKSEAFKTMKPEDQQRWADRIKTDSETSIEDQVKDFETEIEGMRQQVANDYGFSGPAPTGSGNVKPSESELDAVVSRM